MQTFTPSDAPGRMEHKLSWRSIKGALLHEVPGVLVGAMPILAGWFRLPPLGILTFCATALALSYGFYRYQRWEAAKIEDWSFLQWGEQWGEFVTGGFIGAGGMLLLPLILLFF